MSLDQVLRSPAFPMWVTLAAAGFFGLVVIITMLRADKSAANGALTIITLLAVGVSVAATIDRFGPMGRGMMPRDVPQTPAANVTLPALACIDDLAGDAVLAACERNLFGSAETTAAAVSYAATEIERLTTYGDVAAANEDMTPDLMSLRQAVERDRYGLIAHVLAERYRCTPADCAVFRALSNRKQIVANMEAHTYDGLISRYAASWNAPQVAALPAAATTMAAPTGAGPPLAAQGMLMPSQAPLGPGILTGRPTNAEFPTAAQTPPVSIMNPEPGTGTRASPAAKPAAAPATAAAAPAKKPPAPKPAHPPAAAAQAPVQISPETSPPPAVARD